MPGSAADSALVATMLSFVVYTAAAIGAFAARSTLRAAGGLLLAGALGLVIARLLRGAGA